MVPTSMTRIEIHCATHDIRTALELGNVNKHETHHGECVGVAGVQRHGLLSCRAKCRSVTSEKMNLSQDLIPVLEGAIEVDRASSCRKRAIQRIRARVKLEYEF